MKRVLGLALPVVALLSACISQVPPAASVVENSSPGGDTASMVTLNRDGTMTIKMKAASVNSKDAETKNELVIPAQVIAPTVRAAEKQQDETSPF
jgi:hypothetical protein